MCKCEFIDYCNSRELADGKLKKWCFDLSYLGSADCKIRNRIIMISVKIIQGGEE